jgi:hypothetical protein
VSWRPGRHRWARSPTSRSRPQTSCPPGPAVLTTRATRVGLDLSGAVDINAESLRLGKQLAATAEATIARLHQQLQDLQAS